MLNSTQRVSVDLKQRCVEFSRWQQRSAWLSSLMVTPIREDHTQHTHSHSQLPSFRPPTTETSLWLGNSPTTKCHLLFLWSPYNCHTITFLPPLFPHQSRILVVCGNPIFLTDSKTCFFFKF